MKPSGKIYGQLLLTYKSNTGSHTARAESSYSNRLFTGIKKCEIIYDALRFKLIFATDTVKKVFR